VINQQCTKLAVHNSSPWTTR